ncbi:hypothetical protein JM18_005804 [Phytophthora kernoviae]|uniref:Protein kinase domain-containing protein n=2 Tax=Phytophthora kernoviae TaxID=325452 RepID=A0A8T0LWK8_9STRA|nr:hypothetical protein G195_007157 [Phytophthora kernoviae 00238/432]KAG2521924.1 hypothetical protein JM16_006086 [Phytophthora kernoviae]KAG2523359.1 hypothetical protein JM18_005804 [Phytophthora kernoviae]
MMPAKLDDYVIQRRLAPALFGDVLLCQHKPSGDLVAVKRVLQSAASAQLTLASNKKVRENVALERALYHQLNRVGGHPNLLKLRDEIEFDGYLYLVSDFCARGELYEIVSSAEDGKLQVESIKKYLHQIASGVQFLHANGFAHRDLSLENVLVSDDDQCQVCDFGLAASTAKFSRETVGKLFYMAPEVLAGVQYDATKADVWSLGVMLFIMLIGAPPVETASATDARFRLISSKGIRKLIDRWGLTDDLAPAAIDLLSGMLTADPEQRMSMMQVVSHPFLIQTSSIAPQQVESPQKLSSTRISSLPAKQPQQPTASYSSAPSTVSHPESDVSVHRSGCRLLLHKIHRFFSRREDKRVMAAPRDRRSFSKRAFVKRLRKMRLSDFKVLETLAPALFGEVLLCRDNKTGRQLAVKRVDLRCARAQVTVGAKQIRVVESLQQERAIHRRLLAAGSTTNLLLLEEEVQCGGNLYLVFPFCTRGDLFDVVRHSPMDGRLSESTSRRFFRDVVRGLLCMKQNGLTHRDISLENILLDAEGVCHLCDFGLAVQHGKLLAPGRVGKAWYMSPEVYAAKESYDPLQADMWSLGVLLAIMLAGAPLVEKPSLSDPQFRVLSQGGGVRKLRHVFPRQLTEEVWDLLQGLLDMDPTKRLTLEEVNEHPFLSASRHSSYLQY